MFNLAKRNESFDKYILPINITNWSEQEVKEPLGRFKVTEMQLIQGFELLVSEFKELVTDFQRLFTIPKKN